MRRISVGWLGTSIAVPLGLPVSGRYTGEGPKNQGCEEKKYVRERPRASTELLTPTCAAVKVRQIPHFSELIAAPLIITVNDTSKLYGADNPAFSVAYSGFVNGDTPSALAGTLTFSTTATPASDVGSYDVTA
ncbi:MAG TPA: MBG domain-containing protein, partial [Gemmataceae bacterium]|nr:MBG domain-containing protein [Gemmataceae bacterium]